MKGMTIVLLMAVTGTTLADDTAAQMCMQIAQQKIQALLSSNNSKDRNYATGLLLGVSVPQRCQTNPQWALSIPNPTQQRAAQGITCMNLGGIITCN